MDDTLEKLGKTTDYHKLHIRVIWFVLGWSAVVMLMTFLEAILFETQYNYSNVKAIYISFMINYSSHINFTNNLIFITMLRLVSLFFIFILEKLFYGFKQISKLMEMYYYTYIKKLISLQIF